MTIYKISCIHMTTLLCLCSACSLFAQSVQPAGRILMTQGQVAAIDIDGNTRPITRRSEIFVGENIVTSANAFAQIRMADSAVIALGEETEFSVNKYAFDGKNGNADVAILELVRGRLRSIGGQIGDDDADVYRLNAQAATVSQSGASFECAIEMAKLYCGVFYGSINMSNAQNSVDLGINSNWDFAEAEFAPVPITPLLSMPSALGSVQMNTSATPSNAQSAPANGAINSYVPAVDFPVPQAIKVTPYKKSP